MGKKIVLFLVCFLLGSGTMSVYAADKFTSAIKKNFFDFIVWAHNNDWMEYNRFAIHDFDGDGIPEILFGVTDEVNRNFVRYEVVKYSNGDFKQIGKISNSRYLMKDKYSHAILGLYGARAEVTLNNFYVHNGTIQQNTILYTSGNRHLSYNTSITQAQYEQELYNYLGSYTELLVHDNYNSSVILTAIYTWKPVVMASPYGAKLKNNTTLSKAWQVKYAEFLNNMTGPGNTYSTPYENANTANVKYTRYALHDFNNDGLPELLIGVNHNEEVSFDVYRYINGDVRFIGSFDSYSRYISKYPDSNTIFSYNPINDLFNYQTVSNVYLAENALKKDVIMEVYSTEARPTRVVYAVNGKTSTLSNYNDKLIATINKNKEINTYDIDFVPFSAVLSGWRGN